MLKLVPLKEGSTLSFTVKGSEFLKELRQVSAMFKSGSDCLLAIADGQMAVVATDNVKSCLLMVSAEDIKGRGCFLIDATVMSGVLNNRDMVKFTLDSSQLSFTSVKGKYNGEMTIQPASSNVLEHLNETFAVKVESLSIPDSVFAELDRVIKHCDLKDAYSELGQELIRYVVGDGSKLSIITYDQFHSVVLQTKLQEKIKKPFTIAVYQSHFGFINTLARGTKLNLALSDRYFYVSAPHFFLSLPPIQYNTEEFGLAYEMMQEMAKAKKTASCTIDTTSLGNAIDNLCSIYELGSKIEFKLKGEKVNFKLATSYGSINDTLKVSNVEGACEINFDAPPINDVLRCAPEGEGTFSVIDGKAYLMQFKTDVTRINYMVAVLQK